MKLLLLTLFFTFLLVPLALIFFNTEGNSFEYRAQAEESSAPSMVGLTERTVESLIEKYALEQGLDPETMIRLAFCESSLKTQIWGDSDREHPAYGIYQYQERTFYWLAGKFGFKGDWKNTEDQIELTMIAFKNGYQNLWSCYE